MAKKYTDDLADWIKKKEKTRSRKDKGLVAFIAVKEDVETAMEAGYALKTIWEHMSELGKLPYRYDTFLKHVKKHIKSKAKTEPKVIDVNSLPEEKKVALKKAKAEGFKFDSSPNKEDLL